MTLATGPAPGSRTWSGPVFGVDVVPLARAQQLLDRYALAISARVGTASEIGWIGPSSERLGAVLGMKEAAIKALAGRPEPFTWQQISTGAGELWATFSVPAVFAPGGWPDAVTEVMRGFAQGMGLDELTTTSCELLGPALERARAQLPGPGIVSGAAGFGVRDGNVFAATCFWREGNDE